MIYIQSYAVSCRECMLSLAGKGEDNRLEQSVQCAFHVILYIAPMNIVCNIFVILFNLVHHRCPNHGPPSHYCCLNEEVEQKALKAAICVRNKTMIHHLYFHLPYTMSHTMGYTISYTCNIVYDIV
jgi:hypothetical protein